ncbi:MAG: hypothetical protein QM740_15065 [Acidovorax sp.]
MLALALAAGWAGCCCLYLASAHQRWRAQPLPARPARGAGWGLLALSLWAFAQRLDTLTAVFTWATLLMLALAALPYLGALRRGGRP